MKFLNFVKNNKVEIVFLLLVTFFFYLYFVVYMTPSKHAWYVEMNNQIDALIFELNHIGN